MDRCCGTCGWGDPVQDHPTRVDCLWIFSNKTPDAICGNQSYMHAHQGTNCPCWKAKE